MQSILSEWEKHVVQQVDLTKLDPYSLVQEKEHWTAGKKKLYINGLDYEKSNKPIRSNVYQKFVKAYEEYPR